MVESVQHQRSVPEETVFVTMSGSMPSTGECDIAQSLPDFALLALPDDDLWRIEDHVASCPSCQAELSLLLDTLATLAMPTTAPPRPRARAAFLSLACGVPEGDVLDGASHGAKQPA